MLGGVKKVSSGSARHLSDTRRSWNAGATSLSLTVIGFLTGAILLGLPNRPFIRPIIMAVILTAFANLGAYLLVRMGKISLGAFVMIFSSLAQHIVIANNREAVLVTPYFASTFVMIAATCVTRKWLPPVYAMSTLAIVAQFCVGRDAGVPIEQMRGPYIAAAILLCITSVVAWLHTSSLERAVQVGLRREEERELLSVELEKAARMEALGRLAGGIAHDFNNLLVVVQGSAELAKDDLGEDHPAWQEIQQIQGAARRAAELTGQLLAFSRRQLVPTARIEPSVVVAELQPLLERLLGARISLKMEIEEGDTAILASSTQLEQVILNLAANARDATEGQGSLTISVRVATTKEGEANDLPAGTYLEIAVKDTGTGIPEEVMEHLFEPFFTTKEAGKGTGLGLATSFGIVHQMGGTITVASESGVGSTFRVLIPPMEAPPRTSMSRLKARGAAQHALVIDDDNRVRQLVKRVLSSEGAEVLEASDRKSSLEAARGAQELDLIVTDVVLSIDNGMDLLGDLRDLHPNARLVVMSSFSPEKHVEAELLEMGAVYLAKPFSPASLSAIARGEEAPELEPPDSYVHSRRDTEPPDTSRSG